MINQVIKTFEYKGYNVVIGHDELPIDPREDDELTMTIFYGVDKGYPLSSLTDEEGKFNPDKVLKGAIRTVVYRVEDSEAKSGYHYVPKPFRRWDDSAFGVIAMPDTSYRDWQGESVIDELKRQVYAYDSYVNDTMCCYEITDKDGTIINGCGNCYDAHQAERYAKEEISQLVEETRKYSEKR